MRSPLFLLLLASVAAADPVLRNAGTRLGPVVQLDCSADGGIACARTASTGTGKLSCNPATATEKGCVSVGDQIFTGTKTVDGGLNVAGPLYVDGGFTVNGASTLDGGLVVNGTSWLDGGTFVNASLSVDGGFGVTGDVYLDGGVFINGLRPPLVSYSGSYAVDHAWMDGGTCNNYTMGLTGPTCGDGCLVSSENPQPIALQLTCQFENGDGGSGAATRVRVVRCCNDETDGVFTSCDPPSTTYRILGLQ